MLYVNNIFFPRHLFFRSKCMWVSVSSYFLSLSLSCHCYYCDGGGGGGSASGSVAFLLFWLDDIEFKCVCVCACFSFHRLITCCDSKQCVCVSAFFCFFFFSTWKRFFLLLLFACLCVRICAFSLNVRWFARTWYMKDYRHTVDLWNQSGTVLLRLNYD